LSARRLLALAGIGMILAGYDLRRYLAVFVLHQNGRASATAWPLPRNLQRQATPQPLASK